MKKVRLQIFIIVALIVLGLIWYFAYPIKIQNVMGHTNKIEKIDFLLISHGEIHPYSMQFNKKTNISEMIKLLDSVTYNREIKTYKGSSDRVISMIISYRNREGALANYIFQINESGIIISNNKQYQMNGDTGKVFNNLYEWIKNEGVYIPSQKIR